MSREEAIEWLEAIEEKYIHSGDESFDNKRRQAIHLAIKALEREQQLLDYPNITTDFYIGDRLFRVKEICAMTGEKAPKAFERMVEAPRSIFVTKKGVWMYSADGTICSNCGYKLETTGLLSYCPHCNANMKEGILYTNTEIEE